MEPKNYTYDEAFEASLKYFKGDELAARVWVNKYALKDSYGNIYEKNPDEMHFVWQVKLRESKKNILILLQKSS